MTFLDGLHRSWISLALPGSGEADATYVGYDRVPPAPDDRADWTWLRAAPPRPDSALAVASSYAVTDLGARVPGDFPVPDDLAALRADPELRRRLPSATDAYFDLGDQVEPVDGGALLHLVSDSQWVCHWLVFADGAGGSAVVATGYPVGFELGPEDQAAWQNVPRDYVLVADSVAEFVWRWWMDHTIFFDLEVDGRPPTAEQAAYLRGCTIG